MMAAAAEVAEEEEEEEEEVVVVVVVVACRPQACCRCFRHRRCIRQVSRSQHRPAISNDPAQ